MIPARHHVECTDDVLARANQGGEYVKRQPHTYAGTEKLE
jgi:hypothetical protein